MINLKTLQPTTISKDLRGKYILIYSLPKVGKTTFISQVPKHLIVSFEPGTNALNGAMVAPMTKWIDFKQLISQLRDPEVQKMYEVIGIDTADKAWEMCEKYICIQNNVSQIGDLAYGKGYDLCKKEYSSTLEEIARLGYGLIFTSHSTEKKMKDEKGEDYISLAPALPQRPYDIINKMVDIIGYIRTKADPNRGGYESKIYFRGNDNFLAGSRFKYIEPVIDFSYENVKAAIYNAIDKEIEISGGTANEDKNVYFQQETSLDFDSLMGEARQLWGQIVGTDESKAKEILAKAETIFGKSIKISEVPPEQVELLDVLVSKMRTMA